MNKPLLTAKAVFDQAHEIDSPDERKAYLDEACVGAPELRQKVEALLRAYEDAGSFMQRPVVQPRDTGPYRPGDDTPGPFSSVVPETANDQSWTGQSPPVEGPGSRIGPYRLTEQLGEGGMGSVYLAEQDEPIRRQVALKIIKPGMDSDGIVARFQAERQALTMMDHANIARVLDAGTTESGMPYFVMELVKGMPMTRYCNQQKLTIRERLELFEPVCQAIQHAHQKGIIHRDIKPSNVLIALKDGKPVPKVIDFGLAKATEQPLTDESRLTEMGAIVGTLEYMSPEQADNSNAGVDTRTDIYSLGVMLYELLTGTTPIDRAALRGVGLIDIVIKIITEEPPKPSARVSGLGEKLATIAAERNTEPARLPRLLRGELDWIVLKSLEKDRNRRYETANGYAKDVQRYLNDEPVEACPPTVVYRVGKFARKHRAALASMLAVLAILVTAVVFSTWLAVRAIASERTAIAAQEVMRESYSLADASVMVSIRTTTKLKESDKQILRKALESLPLHEPSATQEARALAASRQFLVANILLLLGDYVNSEALFRKAIQLYEKLATDFPIVAEYRIRLAGSNYNLAYLVSLLGRWSDAEAAYRRAIELHDGLAATFPAEPDYRSFLANDHNNLGTVLRDLKKLAQAEIEFRHAIEFGEKLVVGHAQVMGYAINLASSYHNLGNVLRDQENPDVALSWYEKSRKLLNSLNSDSPEAIFALRTTCWDAANALGLLGKHEKAIRFWQRAIALDDGRDRDDLRLFHAAEQIEEKLKAKIKLTGEILYEAAVVFAKARAAATAKREAGLEERYQRRSLDLLKQARTAGWFRDPQRIKQLNDDKDLALLPPVEFKTFLESLEPDKGAKDPAGKK